MSNEIVKAGQQGLAASNGFEPQNMGELMALATTLAQSSLIPSGLRGKPGDVAVILMHGRELGLSPMRALSEIYVVEGKPSASATLKMALCVRHADVCEFFRAVEATERVATYETKRRGNEPVRFSYSIEDAARAGLTNRATWKAHPKQMLSARCKSILATMVFPDLVGNLYDPDEAEDIRASQRHERQERAAVTVERIVAPREAPAPVVAKAPPAPVEVIVEPPHDDVTGEVVVEPPPFSPELAAVIGTATGFGGLAKAASGAAAAVQAREVPAAAVPALFDALLARATNGAEANACAEFVVQLKKSKAIETGLVEQLRATYLARKAQLQGVA